MKRHRFCSLWALILVIRHTSSGNFPMTLTNVSSQDIANDPSYQIVDQATYDAAVAAMPPIIKDTNPTLDVRVAALEVAVIKISTTANIPVILSTSTSPIKVGP